MDITHKEYILSEMRDGGGVLTYTPEKIVDPYIEGADEHPAFLRVNKKDLVGSRFLQAFEELVTEGVIYQVGDGVYQLTE